MQETLGGKSRKKLYGPTFMCLPAALILKSGGTFQLRHASYKFQLLNGIGLWIVNGKGKFLNW